MKVKLKCFSTLVNADSCDFKESTTYDLEDGHTVEDLVQHAPAFELVYVRPLGAHEGPRTLLGADGAVGFQFAVGPHHGIRIHGKVDGESTYGGELVPRAQRFPGHGKFHLFHDLPVDGHAAFMINQEFHNVLLN